MTGIGLLLLPIILSAVAVFIISAIVHMGPLWHRNDHARLPDEDAVLDALRPFAIPPDDYMAPHAIGADGMRAAGFMEKRKRGPAFLMTVMPSGFAMGKYLGQWIVWNLIVAIVVACIAGHIVPPGGNHHAVFHYTAALTFLSYAMGTVPMSIWFHRRW